MLIGPKLHNKFVDVNVVLLEVETMGESSLAYEARKFLFHPAFVSKVLHQAAFVFIFSSAIFGTDEGLSIVVNPKKFSVT